tara:strand:- start:2022 stop:2597 length:576 start_codon:yes stop_codon:yes gene_type:complete
MIKLGVLGSTRGTDLEAIIQAIKNNRIEAEISIVISNIKDAFILQRAEKYGINNLFISHKNKAREAFDKEVSTVLKKKNIELILLIGFMRILSSRFCIEWKDRILNVHPSLLPKYSGGMDTNVHDQVLSNGDTETGCTIHFVNENVDEGPILVQKKCQVLRNDNTQSLKQKVQSLEGEAYIEAIKLIQGKQ